MCGPTQLFSQNIYNYTQFFFNPSLLNASYVGSEGQPTMYLSYKKQWAGLEGSPSIANFNMQTALANKVGLGVNVNNDRNGLLSSTSVLFSGSYTVALAPNQLLKFGLSMGLSSTRTDVNALSFAQANDPILTNLAQSNMQPIGNVGVSYHSKTFHAGIALPTIFESVYLQSNSFSVGKVSPFETIIIHASNRFYLAKDKNVFEPYVVYRLNGSTPSQFEFAGVFHIQNTVYVGASYKQNFGIAGMLGFKINKQLALGYSYTIQNSGTNEVNRPSHEIQVAYLFGKRQKDVQVYSFVNTEKEKIHKKTPQQIAAEKKKHEEELAKQQQAATEKEALAKKQADEKAKAEAAEKQRKADEAAALAAAKRAAAADSARKVVHTPTEDEHLKRLEEHVANPTEEHDEVHHPNAERHEIVKRGGHKEELETGDYVIAGVFSMKENAKKFSDGLKKLGFNDSDYGYLTQNKRWYVHIAETNDIEAARAFRDKFRKMRIFREAWLLTVQK
jgi:type IX secretion system PorP/SprF family membrane protein